MTRVLTAAQMRAAEQAVIEAGKVSGAGLMERAGQGVVQSIFEHWPDLARAPHGVTVICGPGNNGGDGFVVARLLKAWGWRVAVCLLGDPAKLPPDAAANYDRWRAIGTVQPYTDAGPEGFCLGAGFDGPDDLIVDALFGTGLTRAVQGVDALARITRLAGGPRVVAIDLPSGLCSDSGRVLVSGEEDEAPAIRADLTVSFATLKPGHLLADGAELCGAVKLVDIGLGDLDGAGVAAQVTQPTVPVLKDLGHKYNHGHALVLAGPMGRTGAARLAARGALRVGAGLVTVGAPGSAMMECAAQLTAIMLRRCDGAEGLEALVEDPRINALCLGPGMGQGAATRDVVAAALSAPGPRAVVLDADALTAFEEDPAALFRLIHGQVVLTPHGGEFARLFPDIADDLAAPPTSGPAMSRIDAAKAAAARAGCTVLLKGPDTVIADQTGACAISAGVRDRAAPWLGTAGTGDVLAGMIAGLMARGFSAMDAAQTGAWLHLEAALAFGPGLIAEDLPETLPRVFARIREDAGA